LAKDREDDDLPARDEEIELGEGEDSLRDHVLKLMDDVLKGYTDQRNRSDNCQDNWDLYNCNLGEKQFYVGNSKIYLPFVKDAVDARVTRFSNQLFPASNRCVEVLTGEKETQWAQQALIEQHVRKCKLRTRVIPAMIRNGDMEGQYSLYVSWAERKRRAAYRVERQPTTDGIGNMAAEPVMDIEEQTVIDAGPTVEVLADSDLLVLPATVDTIEEAFDAGGSVSIIRRWTKGKIRRLAAEGEIEDDKADELMAEMSSEQRDPKVDRAKDLADEAGIKAGGKRAVVYETWAMLKVKDELLLCRIYFAGEERILSVKRNPFWNDRCPVITAPVEKIANVVKGKAPAGDVADLQIFANDTINEGADTAHYSAMPIVMSDPLKNPRIDTMVLSLAAMWEVDPNSTKIVEFPELWRSALERAMAVKEQIFQTLGVNPSMVPGQTGGPHKKRSQAEIANEQQVDLLTTADAVTNIADGVLTPLIQWFVELDHQFRDRETTVSVYGQLGIDAVQEKVEPILLNKAYEYRWFGVESARNAAQMQQQIAWVNVIRELPPETYPDYELDLTPVIIQGTENVFGPRVAPLIFRKKSVITVDPALENQAMEYGHPMNVHPADDDVLHIQEHLIVAQQTQDPHGTFRKHIADHVAAMQKKAAVQQAMVPSGSQRRGGRGSPQAGGQPAMPRQGKGPPGMIHPESMPKAGATPMPRKMG
jgi:hypothetical protein